MTEPQTPARRPRVYVAGPYTQGGKELNLIKALECADKLIYMGFAPLVPHLSHVHDALYPQDYETWTQIDLEWVKASHVVFRILGYSPGADRETTLALKFGLHVFTSYSAIAKWKIQWAKLQANNELLSANTPGG